MAEEKAILPEQQESKAEVKYLAEADVKLSNEERLLAFISKRSGQTIKLNDFLKSLYPLPVLGAPPLWKDQGNNKRLRVLLEKLQAEKKIEITANTHLRLGRPYFDNDQNPVTKYYDISTIILEAVIF
jgi:hypothetical protein